MMFLRDDIELTIFVSIMDKKILLEKCKNNINVKKENMCCYLDNVFNHK